MIITLLANLLFNYVDTLTVPIAKLLEQFRGSCPLEGIRSNIGSYNWFLISLVAHRFFGGHSKEDPPVPIPNTEVKLFCADGTAWVTVWESRSPPIFY